MSINEFETLLPLVTTDSLKTIKSRAIDIEIFMQKMWRFTPENSLFKLHVLSAPLITLQ
jgi:hypothetical protein